MRLNRQSTSKVDRYDKNNAFSTQLSSITVLSDNRTEKPANMMLIDDDPDVLFSFNAALHSYSEYNIDTFTYTREALKRFLE
jgi:hypothetical protein